MSDLQDSSFETPEPATFLETTEASAEPTKSKRTIWIVVIVAVLLLLCCCCLVLGAAGYLAYQQIDFEELIEEFSRFAPLVGSAL